MTCCEKSNTDVIIDEKSVLCSYESYTSKPFEHLFCLGANFAGCIDEPGNRASHFQRIKIMAFDWRFCPRKPLFSAFEPPFLYQMVSILGYIHQHKYLQIPIQGSFE